LIGTEKTFSVEFPSKVSVFFSSSSNHNHLIKIINIFI
jgi:hypothetical protein